MGSDDPSDVSKTRRVLTIMHASEYWAMFKPTTPERFREMLEIFPHAHQDAKGFLGGKPSDHLRCTVTGEVRATYPAFIEHQGRYYESTVAITVPEYEDFDPKGLP